MKLVIGIIVHWSMLLNTLCCLVYLVLAEDGKSGPGTLVISMCFFCLIALMLPTVGEKNTFLPPYLHLTVNQKLIAAYILGKLQIVPFI